MKFRLLIALVVSSLLLPAIADAQALTSLSSLRVRYNSQKARLQPTGELQTRLEAVDAAIAEATRLGLTGETRRWLAKGTTLLSGNPWTAETDFANSLVIRSDRVVVDPANLYSVRLEQIYSPDIELNGSLQAHASLRAVAAGQPQAAPARELGNFEGVGRDLRESPFFMDLDLAGVPDGTYLLDVDVLDGSRPIGKSQLAISVKQGLNALVTRLEQGAASAPASLSADILYPVDRMRQVNRGRLELRTFDPQADFAAAEAVLAASQSGRDPFAGRTGDFKRHYLLASAGEIMPYRLYVPSGYDASRTYPLIVALHGLGGTENSFFENYDAAFPVLAEQHGYIVAAPLGYRVDGSYGWGLGNAPDDFNTRTLQQRSEEDVMQVLARVREDYKLDPARIYLTGHSMGAIGSWKIGPKYPEIWAAMGMFAGAGAPQTLEAIRHIPQFVVHGDADPTVNVRGSRTMVARMKELEMTVQYIEVPGGNHGDVVAPNFPGLFDFFDAHHK